jgi:hypothetical protein
MPATNRVLGRGLQYGEAPFFLGLSDAESVIYGPTIRKGPSRCAPDRLRALAPCSRRATRRTTCRGSKRHWTKLQWQVRRS